MKKMQQLTYITILFTLVLVGCGRKDEADAERLVQVHEQVEALYNEEMNDLADDLSTGELEEVEDTIQVEKEEELSENNEETLNQIEGLFNHAVNLYELEEEIHALFKDGILIEKVRSEEIDELSQRLNEINQEKWTSYVDRQEEKLIKAEEQFATIKQAKESIASLYEKEGQVRSEVTRADENTAQEAVAQVQNENIQIELQEQLKKVEATLTEREVAEQAAREAEEAARKEAEKATKSIGDFAGYYHEEEYNYLITISENNYKGYIPHSGSFFDYEIVEIIQNTGDEITLVLYHEEFDEGGHYIPETTTEMTWKLVDGGRYLQAGPERIRSLTAEEYRAIEENPW